MAYEATERMASHYHKPGGDEEREAEAVSRFSSGWLEEKEGKPKENPCNSDSSLQLFFESHFFNMSPIPMRTVTGAA